MKLLKVAFAFALLVTVFTVGISATNATKAQDTSEKLESYVPQLTVDSVGYQSNVPTFEGKEVSLADSLQSASSTVVDPTLKDLLNEAAKVIKERPQKGDSWESWVTWAFGAVTLVAGIIGYITGKRRKVSESQVVRSPIPPTRN